MLRGQEAGEPDPGEVTLSEGALLQAVLERELVLFQQILHRTLVLCFAFTDGLLLKRGEGAMCKSYSECSLCVCFLKPRSHFFLLYWAVLFNELSSMQSSLREVLTKRRLGRLFPKKPC